MKHPVETDRQTDIHTMMPSCINPRRSCAGLRCGYSSVLVTCTPQTCRHASYSSLCTG